MKIQTPTGKLIGMFRQHVYMAKLIAQPAGWAINADVIKTLKFQGCEKVIILDAETKEKYSAKFEDFINFALMISNESAREWLLPSRYWTKIEPKKSLSTGDESGKFNQKEINE
jgi:hypothetical protein